MKYGTGMFISSGSARLSRRTQQEDRRKERVRVEVGGRRFRPIRFYAITTGKMKWQGEWAYVNIVQEVTETRVKEEQLKAEAYQDMLTRDWQPFLSERKSRRDFARQGSRFRSATVTWIT